MPSRIAQLRAEIAEQYTAAVWGLYGIADTSRHAFITRRMEHIGACHESLKEIVGEEVAARLMIGAMEASHDELQRAIADFNATPSYVQRFAGISLRVP
jgi:hypothetical protein